MNFLTFPKTLLILIALSFNTVAYAQSMTEEQNIRGVILAYGKAMNASDTNSVVALYAHDGVFMPSKEPTATGLEQIRAAYAHEFKVIDLDVKIVFDEVLRDGDIAYVRSRSEGQLTLLATGKVVPTEAYRAFFVLKKIDRKWKIARFMFNFSR
ncbi:MAG: SgcJ/EcaC family oxidoreductase [Ectothiorhodospiraceae bacterium]|nr:SgcJ/EcaC family oxidoreductase [Ectothiorhodospiraceae bacterium]